MTERLYFTDSYATEFDATLLALAEMDGQPAVQLDQTCFYPTSGGQPFDTGHLGQGRVVDVVAREDGAIWHLLDAALDGVAVGQPLHGRIDWSRRYDHMQQHSGQHLLSQTFYRLFGYETASVHFGAVESTLDLDVASIEQAQVDDAERYANELVYAALPIKSYFVPERDLASVPLRRPPKVTGTIRIVEIEGFDYSACGGTHVRTTAEIGPVKLTRQERRRGQTRLTFLCGRRAYADYVEKHRLLVAAANRLSTDVAQVPGLIERNLVQLKELQREVATLTERQLVYEAAELVHNAQQTGAVRVIAQHFADRDVNALKTLANLLQQQPQTIALLGSGAGGRLTVIFARSPDVELHMGNLLRDALHPLNGKGGGRPDFAQGGAADGAVGQELLIRAVAQIKSEIGD